VCLVVSAVTVTVAYWYFKKRNQQGKYKARTTDSARCPERGGEADEDIELRPLRMSTPQQDHDPIPANHLQNADVITATPPGLQLTAETVLRSNDRTQTYDSAHCHDSGQANGAMTMSIPQQDHNPFSGNQSENANIVVEAAHRLLAQQSTPLGVNFR
jgi:hypothetical protein